MCAPTNYVGKLTENPRVIVGVVEPSIYSYVKLTRKGEGSETGRV